MLVVVGGGTWLGAAGGTASLATAAGLDASGFGAREERGGYHQSDQGQSVALAGGQHGGVVGDLDCRDYTEAESGAQ